MNIKKLCKKLNSEEVVKGTDFIQWCLSNKKDIFKVAFVNRYMEECVREYKNKMEVDCNDN